MIILISFSLYSFHNPQRHSAYDFITGIDNNPHGQMNI